MCWSSCYTGSSPNILGCYFCCCAWHVLTNGYGSIPTHTIFRGMNIHLPAILMFTRGTRFWHTAKWIGIKRGFLKIRGAPTLQFPWKWWQIMWVFLVPKFDTPKLLRPWHETRWENGSCFPMSSSCACLLVEVKWTLTNCSHFAHWTKYANADAYGPYGYGWMLTYEHILQVKLSILGGAFRPPRETSDNHCKGFD